MSQLFADIPLKRNPDRDATAADLENKIVAIYFSAHWCPPCRMFTPVLREFYEALSETNEFEVVFVSGDNTAKDQEKYLAESHGNWLYIPFEHEALKTLKKKYKITTIPALVVIKADGTVITTDGRNDVQSGPLEEVFSRWKSNLL